MSKDRGKLAGTSLKSQEDELASLKSLRSMLNALQVAAERIKSDIESATENHTSIKSKSLLFYGICIS